MQTAPLISIHAHFAILNALVQCRVITNATLSVIILNATGMAEIVLTQLYVENTIVMMARSVTAYATPSAITMNANLMEETVLPLMSVLLDASTT